MGVGAVAIIGGLLIHLAMRRRHARHEPPATTIDAS
jgi:hypothetical protein